MTHSLNTYWQQHGPHHGEIKDDIIAICKFLDTLDVSHPWHGRKVVIHDDPVWQWDMVFSAGESAIELESRTGLRLKETPTLLFLVQTAHINVAAMRKMITADMVSRWIQRCRWAFAVPYWTCFIFTLVYAMPFVWLVGCNIFTGGSNKCPLFTLEQFVRGVMIALFVSLLDETRRAVLVYAQSRMFPHDVSPSLRVEKIVGLAVAWVCWWVFIVWNLPSLDAVAEFAQCTWDLVHYRQC